MARLAKVWSMAIDVLGSDEAARRFMFEAQPLLHGRTPRDVMLESELGRSVVEGIRGSPEHGAAL